MNRRSFLFRTVATMIALRVPLSKAADYGSAQIRLGVPVYEPGKGFLLLIAGPDWRLTKKLPITSSKLWTAVEKKFGLQNLWETDHCDMHSREILSKLVAAHSDHNLIKPIVLGSTRIYPAAEPCEGWEPLENMNPFFDDMDMAVQGPVFYDHMSLKQYKSCES